MVQVSQPVISGICFFVFGRSECDDVTVDMRNEGEDLGIP